MTPRARASAIGAFVLLLLVGTFSGQDTRPMSATTFGTAPGGYGALYDLLTELGLPVSRGYAGPDAAAPRETRWWLEARGVCKASPGTAPFDAMPWVEAGGTAVLFFTGANAPCLLGDGTAIPERVGGSGGRESARTYEVSGDLGPRTLRVPHLAGFTDAGDWLVRATVDELPFVLERRVGEGALIVVADAVFLRNAWLDGADGAPLAVDLVRAYGLPVFDEHELGAAAGGGTLRYLARSPALGVFVGLALTGLLFAWHGALVPPRRVHDVDLGAPRLDAFVDAVAALYARSGDHARVLARYRTLTARRLRRRLGLSADAPDVALHARLRGDSRCDPAAVELLVGDEGARDGERGLRAAAGVLDRLVRTVGA